MARKGSIDQELLKFSQFPAYWIDQCCKILDAKTRKWIPFKLWPFQIDATNVIHKNKEIIILKARQEGFTWIAGAYALWDMIFNPIAQVLVFSKDDEAAKKLLVRIRGMYARLPDKFRIPLGKKDAEHIFSLDNDSYVQSFSSSGSGGRSESATLAIMDEAGWMPNFIELQDSAGPAVDAGGKIIILSTVDKTNPTHGFQNLYRSAVCGESSFVPIFCSWKMRPDRDQAWYDRTLKNKIGITGSVDGGRDRMWQEFPATPFEALAPNSLDKRLHQIWLRNCFVEMTPLAADLPGLPSIPGLKVYKWPERDPTKDPVAYVLGNDPAAGNPMSNDSTCTVLQVDTGEEVASLCGKIEPSKFAEYIDTIGKFYNHAAVMVERNNHGGTVLAWLRDHSPLTILNGHDKKKGWWSSEKGKTLLYNTCADAFYNKEVIIHTFKTISQLGDIEGNTLLAPEGKLDDMADSVALALSGIVALIGRRFSEPDPVDEIYVPFRIPKGEADFEKNSKIFGEKDVWTSDNIEDQSYSDQMWNMSF